MSSVNIQPTLLTLVNRIGKVRFAGLSDVAPFHRDSPILSKKCIYFSLRVQRRSDVWNNGIDASITELRYCVFESATIGSNRIESSLVVSMRERIGARSCEDAKVTTPINQSARRKYTTPRKPPRNLFLARVAKPNRTISVTNLSLSHPVACLTYSINCW